MVSTDFPFVPVRSKIAINSASDRLCGPLRISFSRGRSSNGRSFTFCEIAASFILFRDIFQLAEIYHLNN